MKFEATDLILTLTTRPAGSCFSKQRLELILTLSDSTELALQRLAIILLALVLVIQTELNRWRPDMYLWTVLVPISLWLFFIGAKCLFLSVTESIVLLPVD